MECKHRQGYCLPVFGKTGRKYFVDDRGCAKCNGNPKPPKPVNMKPLQPPTELQVFYNTCKGICETCGECLIADKLCKAGHYDRGYFCKLARWPEPPEELKRAKEVLTL